MSMTFVFQHSHILKNAAFVYEVIQIQTFKLDDFLCSFQNCYLEHQ